jgi:23S rRNA (cytidine1920-2'-O)/16S rRNA (cytidine1409-2'-O)-methyltransferase
MSTKARFEKDRLDHLLVTQSLAQSRDAAVRMILAGEVKVNGAVVDKPAKAIPVDAIIDILQQSTRFVSRGGDKLAAALETFSINPQGVICLDVGCSTGGFTDCLLQRGATRVYAVDVGYGQFDWRLRQDPRVVLIERTNIRYIDRSRIPESVGLVVIDVSFISLTKVLPPIIQFLSPGAVVIALVKPQFEVGKGQVGRGGIVREEALRQDVLQRIVRFATETGLQTMRTLDCPIKGKKGNHEILAKFWFNSSLYGMKEWRNHDGS